MGDKRIANIQEMYQALESGKSFDVVIVVSSFDDLAAFWEQRLNAVKGQLIGSHTLVVSVVEDWPGGAGQLLGTLYAWRKACQEINLDRMVEEGNTVAVYHTGGRGMRMAPLPWCERNNKSAIRLPRLVRVGSEDTLLTILEAVIFQTGAFAPSRRGRVCVFWGDQVFIPSEEVACDQARHVEIYGRAGDMPQSEEEWNRDWQSYGLLVPQEKDTTLQREKCSWEQFQELRARGVVRPGPEGRSIMKSLGSFSLTAALLRALLREFEKELAQKKGRLDTDSHLWMPLTSEEEEFVAKGGDAAHWRRLASFKERFLQEYSSSLPFFGSKDLGKDTLWWDYGQLRLYWRNLLKLLEDSAEGEALRAFYRLERGQVIREQKGRGLSIRDSVVLGSSIKRGRIERSVLLGVKAEELRVSDTLIINSAIGSLQAREALVYSLVEPGSLTLSPGQVLTDIFSPADGKIRMRTGLERDGKEDWETTLPGNPCSYQDIERLLENG